MANTYYQIYLHIVFAVKFRNAMISNEWKAPFQAVIGKLINETGCKTYIVNGTNDHVHCMFGLLPKVPVSEVMKAVKAKSSKYVNENNLTLHRFEWQGGYSAFSLSKSDVGKVFEYIKDQEIHHRKVTFLEEYKAILDELEIQYDKQYLFTEPV